MQGGYGNQGMQGGYGNQGMHGGYGNQGMHGQGMQGGYGNQGMQGGYGNQGTQGGMPGDQGMQRGFNSQGGYGGGQSGYNAGWSGPDRGSFDFGAQRFQDQGTYPDRSMRGVSDRSPSFRGRGPSGYQRSDERIREDVCDRLTDDDRVDAAGIDVAVKGCEVTLTGSVPDKHAKRMAEDIAESVPGVKEVQNQLRVQGRGESSEEPSHGRGGMSSTSSTTLGGRRKEPAQT
jgi:hypothetical protein